MHKGRHQLYKYVHPELEWAPVSLLSMDRLLKSWVLCVGPCQSGKTVLANFLTEYSDITDYNPTQEGGILELENTHVTSNSKGTR